MDTVVDAAPWLQDALENALHQACTWEAHTDAPTLVEAMKHAVLCGGKRLRPALCFGAYMHVCAAGGAAVDLRRALPAAVAVELLHAASLILDDMPCMDNDVLRRGRPCVHVVYGEATAMLAASCLVLRAFKYVMHAMANESASLILRVTWTLLSAAQDMASGQVLDLQLTVPPPAPSSTEARMCDQHSSPQSGTATSLDEGAVRAVHAGKTAALITAAVTCGALIAHADGSMLHQLGLYGKAVGMAFQIADDIIDVTSDAVSQGKACGKDALAGKPTYVRAVGLACSRREVVRLIGDANTALGVSPTGGEAARTPLEALAGRIAASAEGGR